MLATIIGTPKILKSKIPLKYIAIHIYNFLGDQGDWEHEIVQPWLPIPHDYKYEEHRPNSIHHKE